MQLRSGDVLIRQLRDDDAEALFAAVGTALPGLEPWLPWSKPQYDLADAAAWIALCRAWWRAGTAYSFGVFSAESGELLGGVGLMHLDQSNRSAQLVFWMSSDARGQGVAVTAARLAAAFGFKELGLVRLALLLPPEDRASLRVAVKVGAVCEGIGRNALIVHGRPREAMVHSLIPGDLERADDAP